MFRAASDPVGVNFWRQLHKNRNLYSVDRWELSLSLKSIVADIHSSSATRHDRGFSTIIIPGMRPQRSVARGAWYASRELRPRARGSSSSDAQYSRYGIFVYTYIDVIFRFNPSTRPIALGVTSSGQAGLFFEKNRLPTYVLLSTYVFSARRVLQLFMFFFSSSSFSSLRYEPTVLVFTSPTDEDHVSQRRLDLYFSSNYT